MPAPICLFVYNRPNHTDTTVRYLKKNVLAAESELFIFSDSAKSIKEEGAVKEVRDYIRTIDGFKEISIIEREKNYGLAKSIISGVSEIITKYGKAIVVEDDLITSPYFLQYMNDGLTKYADNPEVASIHGYCYPVKNKLPETFFIKGADCWGWATWKRAWEKFEADGRELLKSIEIQGCKREFNFNNSYNYFKMLKKQVSGKNSSWAIRWYASAFLNNMYTLYPYPSLVQNIGIDNSGTHSGGYNNLNMDISQGKIVIKDIPIEDNSFAREEFQKFFRSRRTLKEIYKRVLYKVGLK